MEIVIRTKGELEMMNYNYATSLNGFTTKPLNVYKGIEQIGVIQGYFDNLIKKFIDEIVGGVPMFLKFQLKDQFGNVRLHSKPRTFKSEIAITYFDSNNEKCEILMMHGKDANFGPKQIEFRYKGEDYLIYKKESLKKALTLKSESAEIFLGEKLIADWNIHVSEQRVNVRIYDNDFIEDEYLILGVFHAFLYATKG
ncbi:tubby C-terminal domain-like protein [Lentibacillus jeotgali]|uniref:tubby C-terminal domain-like protein n=1 Tax=Lentibacillus jeotgali TaxID=558169 RepID=UPI000493D7CB|nr:hypothetical protein [Lentibacillus jeotgali]